MVHRGSRETALPERILIHLRATPGARSVDVAERLDVPLRTVRAVLLRIEGEARVRREGSGRGTRWFPVEGEAQRRNIGRAAVPPALDHHSTDLPTEKGALRVAWRVLFADEESAPAFVLGADVREAVHAAIRAVAEARVRGIERVGEVLA